MVKLVIEWTRDGGYECGGYLTIACVEYDSPEAFYVHLEEAVLKWQAEQDAYQQASKGCGRCGNTGTVLARGYKYCPECKGFGRPKCPKCRGEGAIKK